MRKVKERKFSGTTSPEITARETANQAVARLAAAEGMVLLKNERHVLPIEPGTKIALYGSGASKTVKGGTGSGDVNERHSVSIYEGLKTAGYQITTEEWIADYDCRYEKARTDWRDEILEKAKDKGEGSVPFFNVYSTTPFVRPEGGPVSRTDADCAIYVLSRVAGEGADRFADAGDYFLTETEEKMLADICGFYKDVIVVVNTGGLMDLSFMDRYENIRGLIQMVQAGMEGGNAFADLISGKVTPSGKLTDSWAYRYEDYPNSESFSHNNGNIETEKYEEGIYVGYRYFDTFDIPVRYGFGYGLSYTDFELEVQDIRYEVDDGQNIVAKVLVRNTGGTYSGKEVVQVYVSCPQNKNGKEYRRLAAFEKTGELKPGEDEEMELVIPVSLLTSYDEAEPGWVLDEGMYGIWIGNSLQSAKLVGEAELGRRIVVTKTEHICPLQEELTEKKADPVKQTEKYKLAVDQAESFKKIRILPESVPTETVVYRKNAELYTKEAKEFVDTLTKDQLISLASGDPGKAQGGNLGAAGISVPGSAGETNNCAVEQGLASIVLADGPAGLRLMKYYHVHEGRIVSMPFQFSLEGGIFCPDTGDLPGERYYQYCTAIPVGTLLAQTWNRQLLEETGRMIGGEMEEFGVTLWLAPGMNIHRNPLCGRNFEYYSEDPFLSGMMAAAITKGVQSVKGCGTTIKHFACNNQEDNRMGSNSVVSERSLRELYLRGFEIAVKTSQPMSIMTSYNLINGVHAANNYDICTKAARNEWGFEGVIMTDWTTTENGDSCTASGCMRAGNDLIMPGAASDRENLYQELEAGTLDIEDVKACISRLTDVVWKSNQYEE